jgi:SAM-dependent methyltransferase
MASPAKRPAPYVKGLLRRSKRIRSSYAFLVAFRNAARASPRRVVADLESEYVAHEDPWRYATNPAERQRYATALEMLDVEGIGQASAGLEIGCGEGFFTEQLAPRCDHLLAVDLSPLALERAAVRCDAHPNVIFRRWDVLNDAPLGRFDLVVCMDVLQYIARPLARRRAVEMVARSVAPGGALLLSGVRQPAFIEDASWNKWLTVGARADAARFFACKRPLALRRSRTTDLHLLNLFVAPGGEPV